MKALGADFIKVHRSVPAFVYPAIIREARAVGLPVVGHVPRAITAEVASRAGQKSIEHMFGVVGWFEDFFNPESIVSPQERVTPEMRELFEVLEQNETWVTPTTAVLLKIVQAQDESLDRWTRRRYAPHSLHSVWDRERARIRPNVSIEDRRRYAEQELAVIHEMHRAGVRILAGSDTGGFDAAPGFELHDELRMMVRGGFTPLEALQCATVNPAEFLGILDSHGTVEAGKAADLVLLSGNPLLDIENLDRVEAVVVRGELFRREDLDRFLATAESLAREM
jgi:imidazolonepropionase-like amidohydrolase